jgi:hypothetical protein
MLAEKELPDDVLVLIREYSKPAFVHFHEYNQAMSLFSLPLVYQERLKKKIGDLAVREQIKICIEANKDHHKKYANYQADKTPDNKIVMDESEWYASVSRDKFVALLDESEYRMQIYEDWEFQNAIDNAWRNSDDYSWPEFDEEGNPIENAEHTPLTI